MPRSVPPGLASARQRPCYSSISPRTYLTMSDSLPSPGQVIGAWEGAAPLDGSESRVVGTSGSPALPVVRRLVQQAADAAATGYRPLRLNSSRCASNQAMTSLRFQRLCLPIL